MTGYHVRAMIDGRAATIEVDRMTEGQLEAWAADLDAVAARRWVVALAGWIRDNARPGVPPEAAGDAGGGGSPEGLLNFTCPECGRTSHNPYDLLHRYCGHCHRFF